MKQYDYQEVIAAIQNTRRFGQYTGYEVSVHILEKLNNPQNGIPFIHIAGTNGKGSTTAVVTKILQELGYRVGMFTSPHLVHFEERIRVNGQMIFKEDVTRLGNQLLNEQFALSPTMFDYCLAMAVLYFKEQSCDIMVIETGIGGRYDSTNALGTPEVAVITKVGYDHVAILGKTLSEIAKEKAGIIKQGSAVVTQQQEQEVKEVLECACKTAHTVSYEVSNEDIALASNLNKKLVGAFQNENIATAIATVRAFVKRENQKGTPTITSEQLEGAIIEGVAKAEWKGRMEIVSKNPFLMLDGAHNAHGVHALAESLKQLYPGEQFHFIMGVMADKDYEQMIDELLPLAIDFVTVTPESSRALYAKDLAECIANRGISARYHEDVNQLFQPYVEADSFPSCQEKKTVAFGSLYFIGQIESMFEL